MDGLDVTLDGGAARQARHRPTTTGMPRPKRFRRLRERWPFLLFVALPTLVVAVYLFGFASDQYLSEARFVVRGAGQQAPSMLSGILQSAGVNRAQDDTYAVHDFILSRDALSEMIRREDLRKLFTRPDIDPIFGFPGLLGDDSFESLFKYYLDHVTVKVEEDSGVSSLTVRAFRPEDARRLADALISSAEGLVNRMNERQRENTLKDARKEVQLAEARVKDVSARMADFRNKEALLDPNKQSVPMLEAIGKLEARLSSVNLEISEMVSFSPGSPLLAGARQRAAALQAQIDTAKSKITGGADSLVPRMRDFDLITLEFDFANRQLGSATSSLETARINAERQSLYLEPIVQPNTPDYSAYPKRFLMLLEFFALALGVYVFGALIVAGAREHKLV